MVLIRAGTQNAAFHVLRKRTAIKWGGALAVGMVALNLGAKVSRPLTQSAVTGNVRTGLISRAPACIASRTFFTSARSRLSSASSLFAGILSTQPKMGLTPPQPPPEWNHTAEDITRLVKEGIEKDRVVMDKVGALDPKDCNFESVCTTRIAVECYELTVI